MSSLSVEALPSEAVPATETLPTSDAEALSMPDVYWNLTEDMDEVHAALAPDASAKTSHWDILDGIKEIVSKSASNLFGALNNAG